jgi:transcriptional regulator GlxA family with amidase domain
MRLLPANVAYRRTLEELATRQRLAPAYLSRCFKEAVSVSPMAYLGRMRAEQAAAFLLREPNITVGEIE